MGLSLSNNILEDSNKIKKNITPGEIISQLVDKNNELVSIKNIVGDKLKEQSQAIYISQNYNKVDSNSFDDVLSFILVDVANTKLTEIDIQNKKIIQTQADLDNVLSEVKGMKNFYKPGDIVSANSTFGITKNDICYRSNGKPIKADASFMSKFPECMVCSVENNPDITKTNSWKNTKTNIEKVCLYNPAAEPNSGIPNLKQCQYFCGVVSN